MAAFLAPPASARNVPMEQPRSAPPAPGFEYRYQSSVITDPAAAEQARSVDALFGRIATNVGPSNPRWSTFSGELTPENIADAIQTANTGNPWVLCDMYRRAIEQDAHLRGVVFQKFSNIIARPDRIEPPKTLARDPLAVSIANFTRAVREQIDDFDDARFALLWADGQGWAASEIIWGYRRIRWVAADGRVISRVYPVPVKLETIEGRSFRFDTNSDDPMLWLDTGQIPIPPAKVIFHTAPGFSQIRERRGFMRSCLWLHAMKQWCLRDMIEYLNLYGIPQMVAEYDPKQYKPTEARTITNLIQQLIGQGAIPTVAQGAMNLRTDTPAPQWALVHRDAAEYLNSEMTKVVTQGPLTMESSGGSYGLGDVHAEGAYNGQLLAGKGLCGSLRRDLWTVTILMNQFRLAEDLGESPGDIACAVPENSCQIERVTDPLTRQKILSQAMLDGNPVSKMQYRADLQLDPPKDSDDELKGEAATVPSSGMVVGAVDASEGAAAPEATGQQPADAKDGEGSSSGAPALDLTSTAQGAVITVNEARASMGLGPWPGDDGDLSVAEFMAKHQTVIADASDAESGRAPQENA